MARSGIRALVGVIGIGACFAGAAYCRDPPSSGRCPGSQNAIRETAETGYWRPSRRTIALDERPVQLHRAHARRTLRVSTRPGAVENLPPAGGLQGTRGRSPQVLGPRRRSPGPPRCSGESPLDDPRDKGLLDRPEPRWHRASLPGGTADRASADSDQPQSSADIRHRTTGCGCGRPGRVQQRRQSRPRPVQRLGRVAAEGPRRRIGPTAGGPRACTDNPAA